MPPRKKHGVRGLQNNSLNKNTEFSNIPDDKVFVFHKDEIVWAKMKFFSPWPARVL